MIQHKRSGQLKEEICVVDYRCECAPYSLLSYSVRQLVLRLRNQKKREADYFGGKLKAAQVTIACIKHARFLCFEAAEVTVMIEYCEDSR